MLNDEWLMSNSCAQLYSLEGSPVSLELIMVIYIITHLATGQIQIVELRVD